MNPALLADALAWYTAGFMPVPVKPDGSKSPGVNSWKQWRDVRPDVGTIVDLFSRTDTDGIGLICGINGLEMVELEGRAVDAGALEAVQQHFADHGLDDLWRRLGTWTEMTPSGGIHWLVRVTDGPAARNTKLARNSDGVVLAETRGAGGFVVIAPSAGRSHPTGGAWERISGTPGLVCEVTVDERDAIWAMLNLLDEYESPALPREIARNTATPGDDAGGRPGDQLNDTTSWADILVPHGWKAIRRFGRDRIGWRRPGKDTGGISATSGGAADGVDRLYVFSSSAAPFEPETPYTKFAAWSLLNTNGDYAEAARALRRAGYGAPREPEDQLQGLVDPDSPRTAPEPVHVPQEAARPQLQVIAGGLDTPTPQPMPASAAADVDGTAALQVEPSAAIAMIGLDQTEDALARNLVARFADRMRFCPQRGQWLTWTGSRWAWDEGEMHREHAKALARELPRGDSWKTFRRKALSATGVGGVIRLARTDPAVVVHIDDLDAHPWSLNTPGGVVDLRTGLMAPPDREQLHTRSTTVAPDHTMPSPVWDRFLATTFGGDLELIGFVQRLIGLSVIGKVLEQILPFATGRGANGKGTLFELVMRILGKGQVGYSMAAQPEMLMVRRHSEHPAELAQLAGGRMVILSEIEDGERFAEARVKQLTGNDSINARFMARNPFTFTPSHSLWLVGNDKPNVTVGGPAFWRRILLIPFNHVVPEEERDAELPDKLFAEAPAILAWIARGAADYHTGGLRIPTSVRAATSDYEASQDSVRGFVDEVCWQGPPDHVQIKTATLRAAYERWCADSGSAAVSARKFGEQLRDRFGIEIHRGSGGTRWYRGITTLDDRADEDEENDR